MIDSAIFFQIDKDARSDSEEDESIGCHSDEEEKKSQAGIGGTTKAQRVKNGATKRGLVTSKQ